MCRGQEMGLGGEMDSGLGPTPTAPGLGARAACSTSPLLTPSCGHPVSLPWGRWGPGSLPVSSRYHNPASAQSPTAREDEAQTPPVSLKALGDHCPSASHTPILPATQPRVCRCLPFFLGALSVLRRRLESHFSIRSRLQCRLCQPVANVGFVHSLEVLIPHWGAL